MSHDLTTTQLDRVKREQNFSHIVELSNGHPAAKLHDQAMNFAPVSDCNNNPNSNNNNNRPAGKSTGAVLQQNNIDLPKLGDNDPPVWNSAGRGRGEDVAQQDNCGWPGRNSSPPSGSGGSGDPTTQPDVSDIAILRRRNAHQQERNKHAQQRYRARRKAQFEELQETVAHLTSQVHRLETEKQTLQLELARLRSGGLPSSDAAAAAAAVADVPVSGPQVMPPTAQDDQPLQVLLQALLSDTNEVAPDDGAGARTNAFSKLVQAPPPSDPSPTPPSKEISVQEIAEMIEAYRQELLNFMSTNHLVATSQPQHHQNQVPTEPSSDELTGQVIHYVRLSIQLSTLILCASGLEAENLLHGGLPPTVPCAADDPARWNAILATLSLTPLQMKQVTLLRASYLSQLDILYESRVTLKSQALQTVPSTQGPETVWAETLLLKAASVTGYTLPAQADAELLSVMDEIKRNVTQVREATVQAMSDLLLNILTPMQAIQYVAGSHPFSWNVLAFAKLVTVANNAPPPNLNNTATQRTIQAMLQHVQND